MSFTYEYQRPGYAVDTVIFAVNFSTKQLETLMIARGDEPFKGRLAIPGGFVNPNESAEQAAFRELQEETGCKANYLEQLCTFSEPGRDPRGWVVSTAFYALSKKVSVAGMDDAADAAWYPVKDLLNAEMSFDHAKILNVAVNRLRAKARYAPIGFDLLPETFTMSELHELYSIILDKKIDISNFRKKILMMNILDIVGMKTECNHRPAKIYSFNKVKYEEATVSGNFNFQI